MTNLAKHKIFDYFGGLQAAWRPEGSTDAFSHEAFKNDAGLRGEALAAARTEAAVARGLVTPGRVT